MRQHEVAEDPFQPLTRATRNTEGERFKARNTSARCWRSRTDSARRNRIQAALVLVLAAPEFLVLK